MKISSYFYAKENFDLVVCGHAHGGQVRIPGLLNGLYAPNQGFFPSHAGGFYRKGNTASQGNLIEIYGNRSGHGNS